LVWLQLVDLNVKWQSSDNQRRQQVSELTRKVGDLEQQLRLNRDTSTLSDQQQAEIDRLLIDQKQKYSQLEDDKNTVSIPVDWVS
jgi:hypothetical protein